MKVCTDACLFGAWLAKTSLPKETTALDIGTGTGLLSLMMAQAFPAMMIDAIELDEAAAVQAAENFSSSPWKERLHLIQADVKEYIFSKKYSFIFSNPPFFENDLQGPDEKRNIALHGDALDFGGLIVAVKNNLADDGIFAVLLPWHRSEYFEKLCLSDGFYLKEKMLVKQTPAHSFFRAMLLFSAKPLIATISEITIRDEKNEYSPAFAELLRDYYL